jgi:HK97 family phage major capsid protein
LSEYIKVSNNSIDDIDWLMSEIQTELVALFMLKLDADLLNGTTAANGFDGVNVVATDFSAGGDTMPTGVTPNKYDALTYAITQVEIAHFNPNYIVLNPADVRDMKLTRDDSGAYLMPPQIAESNPSVAGVRIIANTGVTKGSYLVGDFTKAKWWNRKGMELRVWEQNDTDVQAQLKTVTLYGRGVLVVKEADQLAFVKDTFSDTITEITGA